MREPSLDVGIQLRPYIFPELVDYNIQKRLSLMLPKPAKAEINIIQTHRRHGIQLLLNHRMRRVDLGHR
jgi:hypothetical protein